MVKAMHIAGIITADVANGPGLRTSVFVSGCPIRCKGCHNEKMWDYDYGREFTEELQTYIFYTIDKPGIEGLSILGGEPLAPANLAEVTKLILAFRNRFGTSKTIWLYTGYAYESRDIPDVFDNIDVMVDGQFIEEQKDITLLYRGSKNQRIIDMTATRASGELVLLDIDRYGIIKGHR